MLWSWNRNWSLSHHLMKVLLVEQLVLIFLQHNLSIQIYLSIYYSVVSYTPKQPLPSGLKGVGPGSLSKVLGTSEGGNADRNQVIHSTTFHYAFVCEAFCTTGGWSKYNAVSKIISDYNIHSNFPNHLIHVLHRYIFNLKIYKFNRQPNIYIYIYIYIYILKKGWILLKKKKRTHM